jgi:hypothetical protein
MAKQKTQNRRAERVLHFLAKHFGLEVLVVVTVAYLAWCYLQ